MTKFLKPGINNDESQIIFCWWKFVFKENSSSRSYGKALSKDQKS